MKSILGGVALLLGLTVAAVAGERVLAVDPAHSSVEFAVKATVDSFVGKLAIYDAQVTFDEAAGRITRTVFRFRFSDLKTGKADRDEQMNTWQQSGQFPEATFVLSTLTPAADGRMTAVGQFTLHGVTRALTFPVAVTADSAVVAVDGEVKLDTREFGLPVIRKFALLKVDPVVTVRFHLQGAVPAK